jgi:hypothetical protein
MYFRPTAPGSLASNHAALKPLEVANYLQTNAEGVRARILDRIASLDDENARKAFSVANEAMESQARRGSSGQRGV